VLAARLSQDPSTRVALVEAGGPDDAPEIKKPIAFPQLFKTRYDWDFASEPEPGLGERRIYLPRGKTLGGSSAMNAIIYIRGNVADFDGWADKEGAPGWSYREMLPYFIRSECNERGDPRYHGHSGQRSLQTCHDERWSHTFSRYVSDRNAKPVSYKGHKIVIIASDTVERPIVCITSQICKIQTSMRQEPALHIAGAQQIVIRWGSFFSGAVKAPARRSPAEFNEGVSADSLVL
jgi:choline dehydrogenase-like flavoprotein